MDKNPVYLATGNEWGTCVPDYWWGKGMLRSYLLAINKSPVQLATYNEWDACIASHW